MNADIWQWDFSLILALIFKSEDCMGTVLIRIKVLMRGIDNNLEFFVKRSLLFRIGICNICQK